MFLPKGLACLGWAPLPFPGCCELGPLPPLKVRPCSSLPSHSWPRLVMFTDHRYRQTHHLSSQQSPPPPAHVPRGGHGLHPASG